VTYKVCIDKNVLGTRRHLVIDSGYLWLGEIPEDSWCLSGRPDSRRERCLDSLFASEGISIDVNPPERFVTSMSSLVTGSLGQVPWEYVMPMCAHRDFVKRLTNDVVETFGRINRSYFEETWAPQARLLRSLLPAKIDPVRFSQIREESGINHRVVDSFRPGPDGHAPPVTYNRFGTRTGRLTVKSGPDILTLKKEYRNVIVPSDPGGAIVSIDFSALEARIMLYEAGGDCPDADLYEHISSHVFGGKVSRKVAKGAVISELYGSSKEKLGIALGISGVELDTVVRGVRSLFKTPELKKRVKEEFIRSGFIRNRHGRRIAIDEPLDHIFVNSYAQSTGVDVSLLGFSTIVDLLASDPGIRPLFILHDALILDVSSSSLDRVHSISSVNVAGYAHRFPVKVERI
jgi:hypothetical protein